MRFVSLAVTSFQSIGSAQVELRPGLNVLHGPNDLGKSTLATAIRAALLLPPTSVEAEAFHPWHAGDDKPTVTLVFADDAAKFWKVRKVFGSATGSQLWYSKDGQEWTVDAKSREVDEKLRSILPWGIAPPGGKRGLPSTFLTNALLGQQSEAESILTASLEGEGADSGKAALTRALAALAQDPLFKTVLTTAQREVDRFFTEKGKRRSGQGSALTAASEAVKRLQSERETLAAQVDEASGAEQSVAALRARRAALAVELESAKATLTQGRARVTVAEQLQVGERELAKIDAHAKLVREATESLGALAQRAEQQKALFDDATRARDASASAARVARDAVTQASSADGTKQRALERAQLEAATSKLSDERRRLEALKERAASAAQLQAELAKTRTEVARWSGEIRRLTSELQAATKALGDAEGEVRLAEGIVAYGRWRVASDAAKLAAGARAEAAKLGGEAFTSEAVAQQHDGKEKALLAELEARRAVLPTVAELTALKRLAHEKELAEAGLGGGMTITVRPRRGIALTWVADGGSPVELLQQTRETVVEAERRAHISIGDLVELEVVAGDAEKRRAAEVLKNRWKTEAVPVLTRASAAGLPDVEAALASAAKLEVEASEERARAKAARADAAALRGKAAVLEKQGPTSKEELEAKEARIGALPRDVLEDFFTSMGSTWETQCEDLRAQKTNVLVARRATSTELERALKEAEWSLTEGQRREREVTAALPPLLEAIGAETLATVTAQLELNARASAEHAAKVKAVEAQTGSGVESAKQAAAQAETVLQARQTELVVAEERLEAARAALHARQGEVKALQAQLDGLDRAAVATRVADVKKRLGGLAEVSGSEASVERAQALFDEVREALAKAEGALTSVSGTLVREQLAQLDDALRVAQRHERALSVDAESWKLLRDALREAEKTESTHLGNALARPVARRFVELTRGKYAGVTFDQQLRTEAVVMNGVQTSGESVLEALSVGTRDQLATLIRLTVASELKSAIVLDDQLVHTDEARLGWFSKLLREIAKESQVIVLTCRPQDYPGPGIHSVDLMKIIAR